MHQPTFTGDAPRYQASYPLTAPCWLRMLKVKEVVHLYKTELIRQVARATQLPQRVVADVVDATQRLIGETLRSGQRVTVPGFGTFYTRKRPSGRIKDVRSGKMISVPERTVAAFRVGAVLKRSVAEPRKRGRRRLLGL